MAYVSEQDIRIIWDETYEYSWTSFKRALDKRYSSPESISESSLNKMYKVARYSENINLPFPGSYKDLHQIINQTAVS